MDFTSHFSTAQETLSQALVATTRSTTQLSAEDLEFHRSLDPQLGHSLDSQSSRLLELTQNLLRKCITSTGIQQLSLPDVEAIDTHWHLLVDVADSLLERTDTCLDEFNGLVNRSTPRNGGSSPAPASRGPGSRKGFGAKAQDLAKPQLLFDNKPTNNETAPFKPLLESKPHATLSLYLSLRSDQDNKNRDQYPHPYATEIRDYDFPPFVYTRADPIPFTSFARTSATMVDDLESVYQMLEELKTASAIAIDLEHHDTHSYVGLVSLMQISTRDHDWIVDTLKPWRRKLQILNEVFADPGILKVLHGAFMDIVWLQRDLGLYVVGLFDTHHASRALGYPGGSLAYLLKRFVNFDAQKQYQTADWRIRPLPKEMVNYARSDTHFLLYIFDNMRNELVERSNPDNLDQNKIQAVLDRSKQTALQRYEYSSYDIAKGLGRYGWFEQLHRAAVMLSREQFGVFRRVHQWRDTVARQEDESPHQIMAKHAVINIAQVLPLDLPALLGVLHPISQRLRLRAPELLEIIQGARVEGPHGPEMYDLLTQVSNELGLHVSRRELTQPAYQESVVTPTSNRAVENDTGSYRSETSQLWGSTLHLPVRAAERKSQMSALFSVTPHVQNDAGNESSESSRHEYEGENGYQVLDDSRGLALQTTRPVPAGGGNEGRSSRSSIGPDECDELLDDGGAAFHADIEATSRKMRPKAENKSLKRALKSNLVGGKDVEGGSLDEPSFDYNTATSVLHATSNTPVSNKGTRTPPFNPYASAADAPSSAKAGHRPKAGKSFTFKR